MRQGGGKSKGAAFEREICVKLSLWISKGQQEDVFWRSAMSGGRSTVAYAKGKRLAAQAGDITCIHPIGQPFIDKFYPECKDYHDLNFVGLLKGKGNLVQFWCETVVQARNYGKLPLLIAHQARQPTIACVDRDGLRELNGIALTDDCVLCAPRLDLFILLFEDLLKHDVLW